MNSLPPVGLGTWKMRPEETQEAVIGAVRLGYRQIDCASSYGNEGEIGKAIVELIRNGDIRREDLWISGKLPNTAHATDDVLPALEKSLNDLRMDYLDAFLIHWPVALRKGVWIPRKAEHLISLEELPLERTWSAMEKLVDTGLVRKLGTCNFSTSKLDLLKKSSQIPPAFNQVELHPYLQQRGMVDYCNKNDIQLIAYASLGSGDRPKPLKHRDEPVLLDEPVVVRIAEKRGCPASQVLLAWALQKGLAIIPKSVNPEHQQSNLEAGDLKVSGEDMSQLATLDRHYRYVDGSFWVLPKGPYSLSNLWDI